METRRAKWARTLTLGLSEGSLPLPGPASGGERSLSTHGQSSGQCARAHLAVGSHQSESLLAQRERRALSRESGSLIWNFSLLGVFIIFLEFSYGIKRILLRYGTLGVTSIPDEVPVPSLAISIPHPFCLLAPDLAWWGLSWWTTLVQPSPPWGREGRGCRQSPPLSLTYK